MLQLKKNSCMLGAYKLTFIFFSIVCYSSTQLRRPTPRGMASQHLRTFKRCSLNFFGGWLYFTSYLEPPTILHLKKKQLHVWAGGANQTFIFSLLYGTPAPRGIASQHLRTFQRCQPKLPIQFRQIRCYLLEQFRQLTSMNTD